MAVKICPSCGYRLGYFTFIFRYGSDSLIKHPAGAHKWEHECIKCRHKLWIYHNPFRFRNLIIQFSFAALLFSWFVAVIFAKPALDLDMTQTIIFTTILLGITLPAALSLAKYESASFKEEHTGRSPHD